jgi:hypothetical protein
MLISRSLLAVPLVIRCVASFASVVGFTSVHAVLGRRVLGEGQNRL